MISLRKLFPVILALLILLTACSSDRMKYVSTTSTLSDSPVTATFQTQTPATEDVLGIPGSKIDDSLRF